MERRQKEFQQLRNPNKIIDFIPEEEIKPKEIGTVALPFYCNIFKLSLLLNEDIVELIDSYKEVIGQEITDVMEYLPLDDIELYLMEREIDFIIQPHTSVKVSRPMVVTIMGHVDHGKTTLLDTFRNSKLVDQEFGKITQTIGAFDIKLRDGTDLTFIDTPGHEAFTKLRQRGAKATDCVILVISGIEGIQQQTVEVINIIKQSKIPFIVCINKIDRNQADPERVYNELRNFGILVNKIKGKVPAVEISAKFKTNIEDLENELSKMSKAQNLLEETNIHAQGFVIESRSVESQSNSNTASVLIRKGELKIGDIFICGEDSYGKVKRMTNDKGDFLESAIPGKAVEVSGFKSIPQSGTILTVFDSMEEVEALIETRRRLKQYEESKKKESFTKGIKIGKMTRRERIKLKYHQKTNFIKQRLEGALSTSHGQQFDKKMIEEVYLLKENQKKKLMIKADTVGMLESIEDQLLLDFSEELLEDYIIQSSVGILTEEDFELARTTGASFFFFNIDQEVSEWASVYQVGVRKHKLIYNIVEEIKAFIKESMIGDPKIEDNPSIKGRLVIKDVFKIKHNGKLTNIAGCEVVEGSINSNAKFRHIKEEIVVKSGIRCGSLKQNKETVSIVREGEECGVILENYEDFSAGDYIDAYDLNPKFEGITNTKGVIELF